MRRLTSRDLEEIYDVRLLLECECFRLAALRRTAEQLGRDAAKHRSDGESPLGRSCHPLLDIEFHDQIVQAAHHTRIGHIWAIMRGQIQLLTASLQRQANMVTESERESSVVAHRDCLKSIASQDADAAELVARKHLQAWREWLDVNRCEEGQQ